jgi:hypothetical protein
MQRLRPPLWELVILLSFCAGIGNGWAVLNRQADPRSPLLTALTTLGVTWAGWYVWGFCTYLNDRLLFGGHSDYRGTLNVFGRAYLFQLLIALSFVPPLYWLWGWIGLYATLVAWGLIGPRHLGMRTWQAILSGTLGLLMWLASLLALQLALGWEGIYPFLGTFSA